jgi:hypothetical protein
MLRQALCYLESRVYRLLPRRARIFLLNRQMRQLEQEACGVLGESMTSQPKRWTMPSTQSQELN